MPEEPVPITPTRLPAKETGSCGQSPVWMHSPAKASIPGMSGLFGADRAPTAQIRNGAETQLPVLVSTVQRCVASS